MPHIEASFSKETHSPAHNHATKQDVLNHGKNNKHSLYSKKCDIHLYLDIKPAYLIYFPSYIYCKLSSSEVYRIMLKKQKNNYLDKLELSKHDICCDKERKFGK